MNIEKILYTARVDSTGGRDGMSRSDDGRLAVALSAPKEMGGTGDGTNPEQLFAAGYSACFLGAMKFVAEQQGNQLPADTRVSAEVAIGPFPAPRVAFGVDAALKIQVPGWEKSKALELVDAAHQVCPYSNATRGNIKVDLHVTV